MLTDRNPPTGGGVQQLIEDEILSLLLDQDEEEVTISPDRTLHEIGLNSLMLAQLLVCLEAELGVDPFGEERSIADMRTVEDLINAYERALQGVGTT